jgi:hypothetical protein
MTRPEGVIASRLGEYTTYTDWVKATCKWTSAGQSSSLAGR